MELDFIEVVVKRQRGAGVAIRPSFLTFGFKDLMIQGKDMYAVFNPHDNRWYRDRGTLIALVDEIVKEKYNEYCARHPDEEVTPLYLRRHDSGMLEEFNRYLKSVDDNYHLLNQKVMFSDSKRSREDYSSTDTGYPWNSDGRCDCYDELMDRLYLPKEREKFEWAVGSIIEGKSNKIQKIFVFYGEPGSGKSTVLKLIELILKNYTSVLNMESIITAKSDFALAQFKTNPLACIQNDGDMSKIRDLGTLNEIISHEKITVNEKFKSQYESIVNALLFFATNKAVAMDGESSGLNRRLIDINPTGDKFDYNTYTRLNNGAMEELSAIAHRCVDTFNRLGINYYNNYVPIEQKERTDYFYNFLLDKYDTFVETEKMGLQSAYRMYTTWCEEGGLQYKLNRTEFKNHLMEYYERKENTRNGMVYYGFKDYKFTSRYTGNKNYNGRVIDDKAVSTPSVTWLDISKTTSLFDEMAKDWPAQYASKDANETPTVKWTDCTTRLSDIHTEYVHYVKVPQNHIVIDFDLKGRDGKKNKALNLEAAAKFPKTYAEFSKGGSGVHLHYIYDGNPDLLDNIYDTDIEVKVYKGNSSLRRRLSFCNDIPVAHIASGLPLKKEAPKTYDSDRAITEKSLRATIAKALRKEVHADTHSNVSFIKKILDDAYSAGVQYNVEDMRPAVVNFSSNSTHQSLNCLKMVGEMHWKSDDISDEVRAEEGDDLPIVFFDIEVFKNLFLIVWKTIGGLCVPMVNPTPDEVIKFVQSGRLVGFNNRRYDNHIVYARTMGETNEQLYNRSQHLIENTDGGTIGDAYNLSFTDIYDFASAAHKQSLKAFEIELGIHHQECAFPWDQPVDPNDWPKVIEYCCNDVNATEAVWNYLKGDWAAREILSSITGSTPNNTTNNLTTLVVFGTKHPDKSQFYYRNLAEPVTEIDGGLRDYYLDNDILDLDFTAWDGTKSLLPCFPGYTFDNGMSMYRGVDTGSGGFVYAEPGMYTDVALLDVASMHPSSIIAECCFGLDYTTNYKDIRDSRVCVKHNDMAGLTKLLGGRLCPYLNPDKYNLDDLANALKTALNSVYGLTSASFDNAFKDPRNMDNIVAKRGALFMVDLMNEVKARGFTVAHIKTDSIKIPNATPEIINFVMGFGRKYGYTFEHEATYERMCLVNNAVYIAKYASEAHCRELYGDEWLDSNGSTCKKNKKKGGHWEATGAEFQHPYIFKTLFTGEETTIDDMKETKSVQTDIYLDMNEGMGSDEHDYRYIGHIGCFIPIQPGCGGGELMRLGKNGKMSSVTGAKGYRWLEYEDVKAQNKECFVDYGLHAKKVDDAIAHMKQFGDPTPFLCDRYLETHMV